MCGRNNSVKDIKLRSNRVKDRGFSRSRIGDWALEVVQHAPGGIPVTRTRPGRIASRTRAFPQVSSTRSDAYSRRKNHACASRIAPKTIRRELATAENVWMRLALLQNARVRTNDGRKRARLAPREAPGRVRPSACSRRESRVSASCTVLKRPSAYLRRENTHRAQASECVLATGENAHVRLTIRPGRVLVTGIPLGACGTTPSAQAPIRDEKSPDPLPDSI